MSKNFTTGDKVRRINSGDKTVYEIVSWDDSRQRGRIESEDGKLARTVYESQIELVSLVQDDFLPADLFEDDEESWE